MWNYPSRQPSKPAEPSGPVGTQQLLNTLRSYYDLGDQLLQMANMIPGSQLESLRMLQGRVKGILNPRVERVLSEQITWRCLCGQTICREQKTGVALGREPLVVCENCECGWQVTWKSLYDLDKESRVQIVWEHADLARRVQEVRARKASALQDRIKTEVTRIEEAHRKAEENNDDEE